MLYHNDFSSERMGLIDDIDHQAMITQAQDLDRFILFMLDGKDGNSNAEMYYRGQTNYAEYARDECIHFVNCWQPKTVIKTRNILCTLRLKRGDGSIVRQNFKYVQTEDNEKIISGIDQIYIFEYQRFLELKRKYLKREYKDFDMDREFDLLVNNEMNSIVGTDIEPEIERMMESTKRKVIV